MAKKTRIDRRGTIKSLVKRFPPVVRLHWQKRKVLAAMNNRRQWLREFEPTYTTAYEIEMEHLAGSYLVTEASIPSSPSYIITE